MGSLGQGGVGLSQPEPLGLELTQTGQDSKQNLSSSHVMAFVTGLIGRIGQAWRLVT